MKIETFRVSNYKSFHESTPHNLSDGFNIIVGQNNVGKTALLEALSLRFKSEPYRGPTQQLGHPVNPESEVDFVFSVSGGELKRALFNQLPNFQLPISPNKLNEIKKVQQDLAALFTATRISFRCKRNSSNQWEALGLPDHPIFQDTKAGEAIAVITPDIDTDSFTVTSFARELDARSLVTNTILSYFGELIYVFKAERLNVGSHRFGPHVILNSDASNLAEVLNVLQANPERFRKLCGYLADIFPNVTYLSVKPHPQSTDFVEILIWMTDPKTEREDLTIPLSKAGTGIGQVLAILYVVMTSDFSGCIIIDEPNSFLHPSAARKLMQILATYTQHQYIVATHGVEIIKSVEPKTIHLVRWENDRTMIKEVNSEKLGDLKLIMSELGVKLSDVFGADSILWVEGTTEEICYPKIAQKIGRTSIGETSIVAVRSTGDFESKRIPPELILEIYNKLSGGIALLPPAIAFIFDREGKSDEEQKDLRRRSADQIHFLPRRCYENYLIHPRALMNVLNTLPSFAEKEIGDDKISKWLREKGGKRKYIEKSGELIDFSDKKWLTEVNGAVLLSDLFKEISEGKQEYRKTTHSVKLTEWLIEHEPEALAELSQFLMGFLGRSKQGDDSSLETS